MLCIMCCYESSRDNRYNQSCQLLGHPTPDRAPDIYIQDRAIQWFVNTCFVDSGDKRAFDSGARHLNHPQKVRVGAATNIR